MECFALAMVDKHNSFVMDGPQLSLNAWSEANNPSPRRRSSSGRRYFRGDALPCSEGNFLTRDVWNGDRLRLPQ